MVPRLIALLTLITAPIAAADWPQVLGPQRNGVAATEKIPTTFASGEPEIAWQKKLGSGFAGPAVVGNTVFVFHRLDDQAVLDALDTRDGTSRWRFSYPTDYRDDFGFDNGPRAVPLIAAGKVFLFGAEGMAHAVDAKTGKMIWAADLRATLKSAKGFFGRASSPLLLDGILIIQAGGDGAGVVGLSPEDGSVKWKASDHEGGYASGIATAGDTPAALLFTRTGLLCLNPKSGEILIERKHRAAMHASVNAASPVALGEGRYFLSACYDVGAAVWNVDHTKREISTVWSAANKLDCHYATPVRFKNSLIGFHGRQETGTELRCISAKDGTVQWSSKRLPAGTVTLTGDTLVVITERGELLLAKADTSKFAPTARGQILGNGTRALPALSGGKLFARDSKRLVCVQLAELSE